MDEQYNHRHQHSNTVRMPETPPSSPPQIYRTTGSITTAVPPNGIMTSNFVALPPPSYEDAINDDQQHDRKIFVLGNYNICTVSYKIVKMYLLPAAAAVPPPSYDSIYGRVREAQKQSKGIVDFMKNIFVLLLGTSKSLQPSRERKDEHISLICSTLLSLGDAISYLI